MAGTIHLHTPCQHLQLTSHALLLGPAVQPGNARPLRDWPEYAGDRNRTFIFDNGLANKWWDNSWNIWTQPVSDAIHNGMRKSLAYCADVHTKVKPAFNPDL